MGMPLTHQTRTALRDSAVDRRPLQAVLFLLAFAAYVFWWQDNRYALPRDPLQTTAQAAAASEIPDAVAGFLPQGNNLPVLLHFYDQECPCCTANLDHMAVLAREFNGRARMIVITKNRESGPRFTRPGLDLPTIHDADSALATHWAVNSTPQAVLLSASGRLLYKGNYNASRFCSDQQTAYARIALQVACSGEASPVFKPSQQPAFGCPLPDTGSKRAAQAVASQ